MCKLLPFFRVLFITFAISPRLRLSCRRSIDGSFTAPMSVKHLFLVGDCPWFYPKMSERNPKQCAVVLESAPRGSAKAVR
jgi:hypothetical protein